MQTREKDYYISSTEKGKGVAKEELKRVCEAAKDSGHTNKAENQMEWVARMNNIRSRATEIVNTDLIYT